MSLRKIRICFGLEVLLLSLALGSVAQAPHEACEAQKVQSGASDGPTVVPATSGMVQVSAFVGNDGRSVDTDDDRIELHIANFGGGPFAYDDRGAIYWTAPSGPNPNIREFKYGVP
jgi:hypothetical protein